MTATERASTAPPVPGSVEREPVELRTCDGLTLVGELALPAGHEPVATLVTFHPLPTHGGFMDSHLLRKAALRLPGLADLAVLRFNTRGTTSPRGTSDGAFDNGDGERYDVDAAMAFVRERGLPAPWLVGWSFGSELVLKYGRQHADATGFVLLAPPLRRTDRGDLEAWAPETRPVTMLVPEHDDFLRPDEARRRTSGIGSIDVVTVAGARHLMVGETHTRLVLGELVARANPAASARFERGSQPL